MEYIGYVTETVKSTGCLIEYKETYEGTFLHKETPDEVVKILENARLNDTRVRLFYGDTETGRDWLEENDVIGTIGRSTGNIKIPLLLSNRKSIGGGGILDHCIVKITIDKKVKYQHPKYLIGEIEIIENEGTILQKGYTHGVNIDKINQANFKSFVAAERYVKFIKGESNRK